MERNEFFSLLSVTAGMIFLAPVLTSCSKSMTDEAAPGGSTNTNPGGGTSGTVDFNLDLSVAPYSVLNSNGGSVYKNDIIVARTMSGEYVALSSVCTHQGGTVGYDTTADRFHCPNHGSNFATNGSVINGPAGAPLKRYNTQLTGTTLRVYA
jgi:cytochrome b6-f complex iron-sulfur subunit